MRYPGSEKLEFIHPVEQSHLPVRRTLAMLGILPMTFYRCSLLSCATPKMGKTYDDIGRGLSSALIHSLALLM